MTASGWKYTNEFRVTVFLFHLLKNKNVYEGTTLHNVLHHNPSQCPNGSQRKTLLYRFNVLFLLFSDWACLCINQIIISISNNIDHEFSIQGSRPNG